MDLRDESARIGSNLRTLSSSSSVFFSANQSPFFSPRSSTSWLPADDALVQAASTSSDLQNIEQKPASTGIPTSNPLIYPTCHENEAFDPERSQRKSIEAQYCHLHHPRPPTVQQD
ncbi:hypothetical protein HanIR_Chr13g0627851 [Helianthus annuus]|nr:hypothetical protein HanIR_Chr13g0627851 [Helianthus annuus]